mgnify:CR=1 FL=1
MPSRVDDRGNMIYEVEIKPEKVAPGLQPPNPVTKDLVADTGSEITIIPFSNIASWFVTTGTLTMGPIQGGAGVGGGIPIAELFGCIMTVDPVGDPNAGPFQQMECPNMWVFFGEDELEPDINGLLGMDQFDYMGVDPVKSAGRDRTWLRIRTP